jgi:hypothetical protein
VQFGGNELWKAGHLKEYRRLHNLCFKCGENYAPNHTCATHVSTLNAIQSTTSDGGSYLSDDTLQLLESPHSFHMQDEGYLSLYALSGQPQPKAIQLRALVKNQTMIILVDSSRSHTFLNTGIANKMQVSLFPVQPVKVRVANGASIVCSNEVKNFTWWIQGHTF